MPKQKKQTALQQNVSRELLTVDLRVLMLTQVTVSTVRQRNNVANFVVPV